MKTPHAVFARGKDDGRRGQALLFITLSIPLLLGLVGVSFDLGQVYIAQSRLNASTQAAALAGAVAMAKSGATASSVTAAATTYSSISGNLNASASLPGASFVSGYPSLSCSGTMKSSFSVSCYGPSASNAIVVKQQATVPLTFLRLFGNNSAVLSSSATAGMKGATSAPYNVAIVVDATRSMGDTDNDSNCGGTRLSCALSGVQTFLQNLTPCPTTLTSCGAATNGMVSSSVDRVSLYTFPAVTTASVASDYNCTGSVSTAAYTYPLPSSATYQVVGFSSDYRTSTGTSTLNTRSSLVGAVGTSSVTPCLTAKGGFGTYYAEAIYAAQAALVAEQRSFPGSQNVMIILSDGNASASCTTSSGGVCQTGQMPGASTTGTTYMSTKQECAQAVSAASAAANAGTRVYTVAYGAEASGCGTDTSPAITPCTTMQNMASASSYFFSDYTATGGSSTCVSASQSTTKLNTIFQIIAGDLTFARLIPNGTQ